MSLAVENRTLLTDGLHPPAGYRLETAVATTYSVDLVAALLAPLSFAVREHGRTPDDDPIAVLEAVRRYAERTTIFCQAGGIYPTPYRTALTFLEDSIVEVTAPRDDALFHPKMWALRFVDDSGARRHRCLVLSRNLTFDQSWDTIVVLDELERRAADAAAEGIDGGPLADFLTALPSLATRPVAAQHDDAVRDLASTLADVSFEPPDPYRSGEIVPLGLSSFGDFAVSPSRRLLVLSPFLGGGAVRALAASTKELTLVSRAASLDGLTLGVGVQPFVLDRAAENEDDDATAIPTGSTANPDGEDGARSAAPTGDGARDSEIDPPPTGLHAKVYLAERGNEAELVLGSVNATKAAFERNVELAVRLRGRRGTCGIAPVWDGTSEAPGLARMVTPYQPQPIDPAEELALGRAWDVDRWHAALAVAGLRLDVDVRDGGVAGLRLHVPDLAPPTGMTTTVRPLSLTESVDARPLTPLVEWSAISLTHVTPFLAVTSRTGTGPGAVVRTRVLKAELVGDPPERRTLALRAALQNGEDLLRYLIFLLGDPADALSAGIEPGGERWAVLARAGTWRAALFEPLIRAAVLGEDSIDRIAALLDELGLESDDALFPGEFRALWAVVAEMTAEENA